MEAPLIQMLDDEGVLVPGSETELTDERLLQMYRQMLYSRLFDQRAINLQRQGRMGTYAPFSGQEAAQIGSVQALRTGDWLFPTYRDLAACMAFGMDPKNALLYYMGHAEGCATPAGVNIFPFQIMIATQILHAVGAGWAAKLKNDGHVSVAYFGDGSTSKGDFHEALNLASVMKIPVVFFCQNNQYAISVPISKQTASRTIAQKAVAYDMPGVRVDGNDVIAVYEEMKKAVERARSGAGPTLIEAYTYRLGPHTTSDDPTRYRTSEIQEEWQQRRDPLLRLRRYLAGKGLWNDVREEQSAEEFRQAVSVTVEAAEQMAKTTLQQVFSQVYAEMPPELREQQRLARRVGEEG